MSEEQPTGQHEAIKAHFDTRIISGLYAQRHQFFNTQPEALQAQETIVDVLRRELYKPEGNETNLLELGCYVGYNNERLLLKDPYYQDPERTVNLTGIDLSSLALAEYKTNFQPVVLIYASPQLMHQ